ncbi:MAG: hypothetical protein ED859_12210 [Desulfuromonadales bacterium]|nr:MAG: hypothetical protein ED859_12210 [Desulfuromonadales bacterium]
MLGVMNMDEKRKTEGYVFFLVDTITLIFEIGVYFFSFLGPGVLLFSLKAESPVIIVLSVILGWLVAASVFIGLLIFSMRILVGKVPFGRFFITSSKASRWIIADRLVKIGNRSPFRALINDISFLRYIYYRGMGAKIDSTLLLGQRVVMPDPWALSIGSHVLIGDEAIVSGHKVEHSVVTLEPVEIGDDVLIGARAVVLAGVKIGNGAIIGANSVVTRGTVVPDNEVWIGNPARKLDLFGALKDRKALRG